MNEERAASVNRLRLADASGGKQHPTPQLI